jgi:hypothetical protein
VRPAGDVSTGRPLYTDKDPSQVSWFEPTPAFSLAMLDAVAADPSEALLDVGAGASRVTAALLERGFTDLTALDVADDGLAAARRELGPNADKVTWVTPERAGRTVTRWGPPTEPGNPPAPSGDCCSGC